MTCTPANEPRKIDVTDLLYSPADIERRFLSGWWTRGLVPVDNFVNTNWAGLIIPDRISFEDNTINIEYPGRYWNDEECRRSMPKVKIQIQYLCKSGRLYLHSLVQYGKELSFQLYAGHNGAQKFSRVSLEKVDEPCSLERTAGIPQAKADVLELKHLADWLVTMISAPGVTVDNQPNLQWITLFADYTESDLTWAPCVGCIFPIENWSIPAKLSDDNMLQLEARLVVQNIKALGDVLILGSIPETFNVPMCPHNTYLEVTLPDMSAVMHMRDYFNCDADQYFEDLYRTIDVEASDIIGCFSFPEPDDWPKSDDPRWEDLCPPSESVTCAFSANVVRAGEPGYTGPVKGFSSVNGKDFGLCNPSQGTDGRYPGITGDYPNSQATVYASMTKTVAWREMICVRTFSYDGPAQNISCQTVVSQDERILYQKRTSEDKAYEILQQLWDRNRGLGCGGEFDPPDDGGDSPPQPNFPKDDTPRGPNGNGDCFFEAEISYRLQLKTVLGDILYNLSFPIRVKVPRGTANLGVITGSMSGSILTVTTALGGTFTKDLNDLFSAFSSIGNAISSVVPATVGLRNPRILCR